MILLPVGGVNAEFPGYPHPRDKLDDRYLRGRIFTMELFDRQIVRRATQAEIEEACRGLEAEGWEIGEVKRIAIAYRREPDPQLQETVEFAAPAQRPKNPAAAAYLEELGRRSARVGPHQEPPRTPLRPAAPPGRGDEPTAAE